MSSSQESLVVEVAFEIEKDAEGYPKSRNAEALLCKPLDTECSLCVVVSVPFYLRNVAYGDTITTEDTASGSLEFKEIVKRGGYNVYRILLHDSKKKDELISRLLHFDVIIEQDDNLIAFAVPSTADLDTIVNFILEGKDKGLWGAQDGYICEAS